MNTAKRFLAAAVMALLPSIATAQTNWPTQPIRMIVPFAPGGATDFVGRVVQPKLSALLGQQIIVENRSGGGGNVGLDAASRAAPDGYTILLGEIGCITLNPHFYADMRVKPLKDFEPISLLTHTPMILTANPSIPAGTLKELVAYVKDSKTKVSFATPGSSSLDRLVMEQFARTAGLSMNHIPYSGGAGPAVADVVGGHVQLVFTTAAATLPSIQTSRLKAYATSTPDRIAILPDLPTIAEAGYPDATAVSWQGLFVPAGTPKPIIEKLFKAVTEALADPEVAGRIAERGLKAVASKSPDDFRQTVVADGERWGKLIKEIGAKLE